jgi:formylmethanofuran dehydrogenase subunit E
LLLSSKEIFEKAADFHGHLGPFLVIGVRMGLVGLKKLGLRQDDRQLSIWLPYRFGFLSLVS